MHSLLAQIRHGSRVLLAQPTWTIAALLCLAIGTGANTAVFSVINGVLLRPLPFAEPGEIVMIAMQWGNDRQASPISLQQFRDIQPAADYFQQLAARTYLPVGLAFEGPARMVQAEFVTGDYFQLLRLRPIAGRFLDGESEPSTRQRGGHLGRQDRRTGNQRRDRVT